MSLYGRPFVLICVSTFFFYVSFQLVLPVVPLYAAELGGREAHVGSGGAMLLGVCAARAGYPAMWWVAAAVAWVGACAGARDITRPRG